MKFCLKWACYKLSHCQCIELIQSFFLYWVEPVPYLQLLWLNQSLFLHWVEPVSYLELLGRKQTKKTLCKNSNLILGNRVQPSFTHCDSFQNVPKSPPDPSKIMLTDFNPLSHFFLPWTRPSRKLSDHSGQFFASPPPRIVAKYITPRSHGNPEFNLCVHLPTHAWVSIFWWCSWCWCCWWWWCSWW